MEECIEKVLDTRGALRCVRFASGNVGVVNTQGETKLVVGPFQQLNFAGNGFLRVYNRVENEEGKANEREFFIDMKNGELYTQMPEFVHFGDFEIAVIGGYLCTRTRKLYEVCLPNGKVEVEAKYEDVVIHTDGTVDLTVRAGKVISMKLGIRN